MKRFTLMLTFLALAVLACGTVQTPPPLDIHQVQTTIAAGTLTVMAPTQSPPTLMPVPTLTLGPATAVPSPTQIVPTPTSAYRPIRILFAPGGVTATDLNTVAFPNRVEYILGAAKSQRMTVSITSDGNAANFAITAVSNGDPLKRLENEDRTWTGILPNTGDYLITVAVPGGSASFALTVTIVWP